MEILLKRNERGAVFGFAEGLFETKGVDVMGIVVLDK